MATYTLPPDSRSSGSGDPPADNNAIVDIIGWMNGGLATDGTGTIDSTVPFAKPNPDWPPPSGNLGDDYEFNATTSTLPSGWSWINQGSATYNEANGLGVIGLPSSADSDFHGITRTLPTPPFTATVKILASSYQSNNANSINVHGIGLTDGTKILALLNGGGAQVLQYYTSPTAWSANEVGYGYAEDRAYYLQMDYHSSSNVDFNLSADGFNFIPVASGYNASSLLTPSGLVLGSVLFSSSIGAMAMQFFRVR